MWIWYCKKHHTWSDGKSLPVCKMFKLKKHLPKWYNNCIYNLRFKAIQLRLFEPENERNR